MEGLIRCWESLDKVRLMLSADRLLAHEQMERAIAMMVECEEHVAAFANVLSELRAAQMKVTRCELKGEYLDFLESQYRSRGLSNPRNIAMMVVLEEATNALKRAVAATMEQMRRTSAESDVA
jgi:hypothetical protein